MIAPSPSVAALSDADRVVAAEYVLGTLDPDERERVRARMAVDPAFAGAVRLWERRLSPLHELAVPVAPPVTVWPAIAADLRASRRAERLSPALGAPGQIGGLTRTPPAGLPRAARPPARGAAGPLAAVRRLFGLSAPPGRPAARATQSGGASGTGRGKRPASPVQLPAQPAPVPPALRMPGAATLGDAIEDAVAAGLLPPSRTAPPEPVPSPPAIPVTPVAAIPAPAPRPRPLPEPLTPPPAFIFLEPEPPPAPPEPEPPVAPEPAPVGPEAPAAPPTFSWIEAAPSGPTGDQASDGSPSVAADETGAVAPAEGAPGPDVTVSGVDAPALPGPPVGEGAEAAPALPADLLPADVLPDVGVDAGPADDGPTATPGHATPSGALDAPPAEPAPPSDVMAGAGPEADSFPSPVAEVVPDVADTATHRDDGAQTGAGAADGSAPVAAAPDADATGLAGLGSGDQSEAVDFAGSAGEQLNEAAPVLDASADAGPPAQAAPDDAPGAAGTDFPAPEANAPPTLDLPGESAGPMPEVDAHAEGAAASIDLGPEIPAQTGPEGADLAAVLVADAAPLPASAPVPVALEAGAPASGAADIPSVRPAPAGAVPAAPAADAGEGRPLGPSAEGELEAPTGGSHTAPAVATYTPAALSVAPEAAPSPDAVPAEPPSADPDAAVRSEEAAPLPGWAAAVASGAVSALPETAAEPPPVTPPYAVRTGMAWRGAALALGVVVLMLGGFLIYREWFWPRDGQWVGVLQGEPMPAVAVRIDPDSGVVLVRSFAPAPTEGEVNRLWVSVPGRGMHLIGAFSSGFSMRVPELAGLGRGRLGAVELVVTRGPASTPPQLPQEGPDGNVVYRGRLAPE